MKLETVTKLDKRNKTRSEKFDDDFTSKKCDAIAIFQIYSQFRAIQKPDSGRLACKTYIFINSNILSHKNSKQDSKMFNTAFTVLL